jgi:uncharacterized protein GlcG (DUF336 family)
VPRVVILMTTAVLATMPLSLAQANVLIAAANHHALANGWRIAVAVVDEGGHFVALGRMDGAFPLSAQIAEAKAAGTAVWHAMASGLPPAASPTRDSSTRSAGSSGWAEREQGFYRCAARRSPMKLAA